MKILVEREIFDDPEFCSNKTIVSLRDSCPNSLLSLCRVFVNKNQDPTPREFDKTENRFRKCEECKAEYQKAIEVDKWIKELKNEAASKISNNIKGTLLNEEPMISYCPEYQPDRNQEITLDGDFTIEQLEALTNHMKRYNK